MKDEIRRLGKCVDKWADTHRVLSNLIAVVTLPLWTPPAIVYGLCRYFYYPYDDISPWG